MGVVMHHRGIQRIECLIGIVLLGHSDARAVLEPLPRFEFLEAKTKLFKKSLVASAGVGKPGHASSGGLGTRIHVAVDRRYCRHAQDRLVENCLDCG